tara:strand:+ start:323 stop:772 length:450 start_codon:yes stop_codon:yes gene_type:complete
MLEMPLILLGLLFGIVAGATFYFIRFWFLYRSKQKELDVLLATVLEDAQAAEQALKIAKNIQSKGSASEHEPLDNNRYLTTLITVMVKKYGEEIRLTGYDFKNVGFDEYVTLYIDTSTYDVILRSNSVSSEVSDLSYMMPPGSDEDTFH